MPDPVPATGPEVNIAAHTIEMGMTARVISDAKGAPASIILTGTHGMEVKAPGEAYPFVQNGHPVLVIVTVVQVAAAQPTLAGPKPGGIIRTAN